MSQTLNRRSIANALQRFENGNLAENTRRLLEILGYRSDRTIALEPNTVEGFIEIFDQLGGINSDKAQLQEWESIDFLFQLTEAEIVENTQLQIDFEDYSVDDRIIESYLFFVLRFTWFIVYRRPTFADYSRNQSIDPNTGNGVFSVRFVSSLGYY